MGQLLSNLKPGSIVLLNENSHPTKFIVLGNDHYGDGTGVTLLRKDCFGRTAWNAAGVSGNSCYIGSTIDNFCDSIWPQKFDESIRNNIISVPISVAEGNKVQSVHKIYRKGFSLSRGEVFGTDYMYTVLKVDEEDSKFEDYFIDRTSQECCLDGTETLMCWWLRSPAYYTGDSYARSHCVDRDGGQTHRRVESSEASVRPAFNLNGNITVSDNPDNDNCYTIESFPDNGSCGVYVKKEGKWISAV